MNQWQSLTEESRAKWGENAGYWDDYMGEESNRFHREIIRPKTEELLAVAPGQSVLDIACGNGNFSRRLAELGAEVTAIDYSTQMIERAKARSQKEAERIDCQVKDATDLESLLQLGASTYDSAVANMALMDVTDITPLATALGELLKAHGSFVFSVPHPCFQGPGARQIHEREDRDGAIITRNSVQVSSYLTPAAMKVTGIKGQPVPHLLFHRPLSYYIQVFTEAGFMLDGLEEPAFAPEPATA